MRMNYVKSLFVACSVFLLLSCEKRELKLDLNQLDLAVVLLDGQWNITYYFDDVDKTSDYDGYGFTFQEGGEVLATDGSTSVTGTISISDSDANDDSSNNSLVLNILFSNPTILEELSDDWDIVNYTNNKVELKDVSGGDGTTEFLTFEKM